MLRAMQPIQPAYEASTLKICKEVVCKLRQELVAAVLDLIGLKYLELEFDMCFMPLPKEKEQLIFKIIIIL